MPPFNDYKSTYPNDNQKNHYLLVTIRHLLHYGCKDHK